MHIPLFYNYSFMAMEFEFKKTGGVQVGSATGSDANMEVRLSSENFDVKQFVKEVATKHDTSREWAQHKKRVQGLADRTAMQLKQNVFKNYVLFIDSSKEISSLEAEMYQLNHNLLEQQELTHSLQTLSIMETKSRMQEMESAEKQEQHSISVLLETVEGGAIVTEVPDRYLVHSGQLYELDRETYIELGEVRAFLLNDSLMTAASIFKRRGPVKFRFQALFELENMAIVDVKDTDSLQFSFKILMFPDSHLYQAESEEDKRQWIQLLETTKRKHKEEVDAAKKDSVKRLRSQSIETTIGPSPFNRTLMTEPAPVSAERIQADMLMEDWIKEVPENLDVYIAQREFDQAVELILKTKGFIRGFSDSHSHALRDIRARLNHRINLLSEVLKKELEGGSLRGGPRAARRAVGLLIKLGRSPEACRLFLENYRQIILHDIEDVKMEGEINLYITNFATTFFTGLQNAAIEFERAFDKNYGSYSTFIEWCNKLLKLFAEKCAVVIFRQHETEGGSSKGYPLSTITECILSTTKECDALNDIGLDLSFALWDFYHPYLAEVCATSGGVIPSFQE